MNTNRTYLAKNNEVRQRWLHVDASGMALGRLSSQLAIILMGKNKPQYTPHHDVGDYVVVTNVEKVRVTGRKPQQKFFQTYSRYPGGQKNFTYEWMLEHKPELLLERAVRRMLPRNKLARHMLKKLKIYRGTEHPHQSQQPEPFNLQTV